MPRCKPGRTGAHEKQVRGKMGSSRIINCTAQIFAQAYTKPEELQAIQM